MNDTTRTLFAASMLAAFLAAPVSASPEPQMSPRMERAKDYIADEQWLRAIEVLRAAADDAKEKNRDEAFFWLAHSQHQAGSLGEAVETIAQLEQKFPTSRWVKPARSIRVELAQKLRRDDVLWWTITTAPAPPAVAVAGSPAPPATTTVRTGATPPRAPRPGAVAPPPLPQPAGAPPPPLPATTEMVRPPRPAPAAAGGRRPMPPPQMPTAWVSEFTAADTDLRIQALGSLIKTDAQRVIPILRGIALESTNPNEASRAVFVLAQSGRPEAHSTVLEVARHGSEPVSVAAVRELGRFGGPRTAQDLLKVYVAGRPLVKYQVVN